MPPFEHLRALVRRADVGSRAVCSEVLACLAGFGDDPAGLVVACRRLLAHRPTEARLWWACARVLTAVSAPDAAAAAQRLLEVDDTAERLAGALPFPADGPIAVTGIDEPIPDALAERPDLDVMLLGGADLPSRRRELGAAVRDATLAEAVAERASPLCVRPSALGERTVLVRPAVAGAIEALRAAGGEVWAVVPIGTTLPGPLLEAMAHAAGDALRPLPAAALGRLVGAHTPQTSARLACPVAPELLRRGR